MKMRPISAHGRRAGRFMFSLAAGGWLLLSAAAVFAQAAEFSRYELIIARKPFGELGPQAGAAAGVDGAAAVAPDFAKDLRLVGLTETEEFGVRAGVVDLGAKPPKNFYLRIGEAPQDGLELVDASYEKSGALVRRGGEQHWIYMEGPAGAAAQTSREAVFSTGGVVVTTSPITIRKETYAERMRKRREALMKRESEQQPKLSGEELEKHLKEYQMELIRKGMPPLPMPLTKEMDDQLVSEGVLPPKQAAQ